MTISQVAHRVAKIAADNSPLIFTSIGVAGTLTTAILTGRACFQAAAIFREYEDRPSYIKPEYRSELAFKEKVRIAWPLFIPPLSTAAVTVTSIVMANRIGTRRAAALAAAYSISEKAFEEYRDKVIERVGKKDEREIREEISQDRVDRDPVKSAEVIITGVGDILCYDEYSSRYFESTKQKIQQAQNEINYDILNHGYASLNEFYSKLEIPITKFGDELGWTSMERLEIVFTSVLAQDDRPALVMSFHVEPVRDYWKVH